jgi:transposase
MRKIKTVLRMFLLEKTPIRTIATNTGIPYSTVHDNITLASAKGLLWPQIEAMSEEELETALIDMNARPLPVWAYIEKELKRKGVTLHLLWQEYKEVHPDGYQYSRFCELYTAWAKKNDVYTPMPHKAGEELFIDYSGDKMPYICQETGMLLEAEIFVAILGASEYFYIEATRSQELPFWIESHTNAFEYFGGIPAYLIPDNLKSGVTNADRYEPDLNRTYEDMADHYGTFILPARSRKPKDKSLAELTVQFVQRNALAALRDQTFFGLVSLNNALWARANMMNHLPFQKLPGSRVSKFEEIDKPALKPLPATRYIFRKWHRLRVAQNHHVCIEGHFYSVPHKYAGEEVDGATDTKMVEILYRGESCARHVRSYIPNAFTTLPEHMPPKYRYYFESCDKEKLLGRARDIGKSTFEWAGKMFALKGRPHNQVIRTVQGALSLVKEYGGVRVEAICARALILEINSYKSLKSMLINDADRLPLPSQGTTQSHLPQHHDNVRGAEHFA